MMSLISSSRRKSSLVFFISAIFLLFLFTPASATAASHLRHNTPRQSSSITHLSRSATTPNAFKPIFLFHGVFDSGASLTNLKDWILQEAPGTSVHILNIFNNKESVFPLWVQTSSLITHMETTIGSNATEFADGYHLVCHSQGGLVCRTVIELWDGHNIDTFVSLAGVQAGEYGAYRFLESLFPNITVPNLYRFLYTPTAQATLSFANYWYDPNQHDAYLTENIFLPRLNNENPHYYQARYKANFIRLKKCVLLGGPSDGAILPWESSFFGFFAPGQSSAVVPMTQRDIYIQDLFGLRTLDESGRLFLNPTPGVIHQAWIHDPAVFEAYILPWLS